MNTVFIQANGKQMLGARLAEFAIRRNLHEPDSIAVRIMNVDDMPMFRGWRTGDLQSFTLSRFLPPELLGYRGLAVVIDPDIFALTDINRLFGIDMQGNAIVACRKKGAWDSSVMLMDCSRLPHWRVGDMLADLATNKRDYADIISLAKETSVAELPRTWNSLDHLDERTNMLHTTNRLTQPWKTGLPIDFTRKDLGRIWGFVPRIWVKRLLGQWPTTYQTHPDKNIERFFFRLLNDALNEGVLTEDDVRHEVIARNIRPDIFRAMNHAA